MKHLGDEVKRELGRFGPVAGMDELLRAWPAAVGETIAQNAWPARLGRDGTLHVNTADSIWSFELSSRSAEIASRLSVVAVRFAAGPLPAEPGRPPQEPDRRPIRPSEAERARGEQLAVGIEDEKLRKLVARAAAASLARAVSDRSFW
ncbi:MAG TPA: DciA family protein [Gaiellaceae bacterium]